MSPEQQLWQAVVFKALIDATAEDPAGVENRIAKREAHAWIERGGRDFRKVVTLSGMDPDFVREAYLSGKIDAKKLRKTRDDDEVVEAAE